MSQERFDIYFSGELLPDHAPAAVRQWLGSQFKLQGEALERLFSGQPVRIKQGVDLDTAGRYRAAFRQAGALVEIRQVTGPTAPAAAPAASPAADEPELLPANTGTLEDCAAAVEPMPIPDISYLGLADPGPMEAAATEAAARPLPDTGFLDLDTPGHPLDDTPEPAPADIATDHLSAQPANTGDLSDCVQDKPPQPIPDISTLQLADD